MSFCLLVLLLLSSCTEENLNAEKLKKSESNATELQYCFDNPDNPYESAGIQHNLGLDAIAASSDFGNLSVEAAHNIVFENMARDLNLDQIVPYELLKEVYASVSNPGSLADIAKTLLSADHISEQAYSNIIALQEIFDNSPDPQAYGNKVLSLEESIIQSTAYTTFELEVLLGGTSIARHSMCYWVDAYLNPDSPWNPYLLNSITGTGVSDRGDLLKDLGEFVKKEVEKFVEKDTRGYKATKEFLKSNSQVNVEGIICVPVSAAAGAVSSFLPFSVE